MSTKSVVWVSVFIFSIIGGYIPVILGSSFFSPWSMLGNGVGGLVGIWIGLKVGTAING